MTLFDKVSQPTVAPSGLPTATLCAVAAIGLTDLCLWGVGIGGLGLPAALLGWALLAAVATPNLNRRTLVLAVGGMALACLPAVEAVKPASVLILLAGGVWVGGVLMARGYRPLVAVPWFPVLALVQWLFDLIVMVERAVGLARWRPGRGMLADWALPLGLGAVFVWLLVSANPLLQFQLPALLQWPDIDPARASFWIAVLCCVWPLLRAQAMAAHRPGALPLPDLRRLAAPVLSERSVARALVLFNLIFAVQTVSDALYLWGGATLPAGMTYASYAHRGAYPLVITALLAGAFALAAQGHLAGRPALRAALTLWVVQNVGLVASSVLRLDLYVQTYGLTHLRFAAYVWMGLVAAGLALMLWQIARHLPALWMVRRSAALGALTIYLVSFVNVDGVIARVNLNGDHPFKDMAYVCALGPGALPALHDFEQRTQRPYDCLTLPTLSPVHDWREWGFRNHRILSSLTQMDGH